MENPVGHKSKLHKSGLWVYTGFTFIITCAYLLPIVTPLYIGTSYIVLFFMMTFMSVVVWKRQCISPKAVLVLSCFLYILLFPISSITSNDSERYLWDGAVFLSGIDPYVTAPNNPEVADLREVWSTPEEHAQYPTLYPPGALILFSLSAKAGPVYGFWVWKVLASLAAIFSMFFTYKLLELKGLLRNFSLFAVCFKSAFIIRNTNRSPFRYIQRARDCRGIMVS